MSKLTVDRVNLCSVIDVIAEMTISIHQDFQVDTGSPEEDRIHRRYTNLAFSQKYFPSLKIYFF